MKKYVPVIIALMGFSLNARGSDIISEKVYREDSRIDSARHNQLRFALRTLSFFENNEFNADYVKGYTLPGFWMAPRMAYYVAENVKLEIGAHLLAYWGAQRYPVTGYNAIPTWNANSKSSGFHALPFLRAHWAAFSNFDVVLGNIYGGANHNLAEPLYFPQHNLTSDPEAGAQMLFCSHLFEGDLWINWETFIFKGSPYQEKFTLGLSSKFKLLQQESRFELSIPIQALANHRGGEINDKSIPDGSVKTLVNAGSGVRFAYLPQASPVKRIQFETLGFVFYQQKGEAYPFNTGWGIYPAFSLDVWDMQARVSYWKGDNFVSLNGVPFYNSTGNKGEVLNGVQNVSTSILYCKQITKTIALGADLSFYFNPSTSGIDSNGNPVTFAFGNSYWFGASLRINPDFLLYRFKREEK